MGIVKRCIDIIISGLVLIVFSPVYLLIAIAIKLDSPGPVFYRSLRTGRYGQMFYMYKFRTMVVGADKNDKMITTSGDNRVTRTGTFLRRSKLDEFPQFLNVLKGQMSMVGPRPQFAKYVALYTPEQRQVLEVRPGITSLASIKYNHEASVLVGKDWEKHYVEYVVPDKLGLDLQYIRDQRPAIVKDFAIMWQTGLICLQRIVPKLSSLAQIEKPTKVEVDYSEGERVASK